MLHMIRRVGAATGAQRLRQEDVHIVLVRGASQGASAPRVLSGPRGGKRVRRMARGNGHKRDCARVLCGGPQISPLMWRCKRLLEKMWAVGGGIFASEAR